MVEGHGPLGPAAPQWDVGQGGHGLQGPRARIVFEELARVRAPASSNPIGIGLVGPVLMRHGTDGQKELLARIARTKTSGASSSANPALGRTWPVWPPGRCATVTTGSRWPKSVVESGPSGPMGLLLARTDPRLGETRRHHRFHPRHDSAWRRGKAPAAPYRGLPFQRSVPHTGADSRLDASGPGGTRLEIARTTLAFEHSDGDPGMSGSGGAPGRDVGSIIERYGPVDDPWLQSRRSMPGSGTSGQVSERHAARRAPPRCCARSRGVDGEAVPL